MTPPGGSLYVALAGVVVAVVTLIPVLILVAAVLWVIGTWGVRYDERRVSERRR